jgi:hypothetical protein
MGNSGSKDKNKESSAIDIDKDTTDTILMSKVKHLYKQNQIMRQEILNFKRKQNRMGHLITVLTSKTRKYLKATGKSKTLKKRRRIKKKLQKLFLKKKQVPKNNALVLKSYNELRKKRYVSTDPSKKEYFQRNLLLYQTSIRKFHSKENLYKKPIKINSGFVEEAQKASDQDLGNRFSGDMQNTKANSEHCYKKMRDRMKLNKWKEHSPHVSTESLLN